MAFWSSRYSILLTILYFLDIALASAPSNLNPSCPDRERTALLQFKQSFLLDCAAASSRFSAYPTTLLWASHRNEDCCSWKGVKCERETGHVIGLDLGSSCLYGSFPPNSTLFDLSHLQELNLADNDFNDSPIPFQLGELSKLKKLNLSLSGFSGQIPLGISSLSNLSLLDLSSNPGLQLRPSLERLVRNLTKLNSLILNSVDISSPVPNSLTSFKSLTHISLEFCNLYGEFPTNIFHLPYLEELSLSGNTDLVGFLPKFQQTSPLRIIQLSYTSFSGELPPSIGNLAHLQQIKLVACYFSGRIPSSLGTLTNLTSLELDDDFTGDMPSSLTNLTQLQYLALSYLNVRPQNLYAWLSKLNRLIRLDIQSMDLTGEVPSFLANLTYLENLNLNGNLLTGRIPYWLMNLTQLERLSLSNNQFEGSLPQSISQLENLGTLYLYGNDDLSVDFDSLLKLNNLKVLDLSGIKLTFQTKFAANESVVKLKELYLNSCNLTKFPSFLHSQDKLQVLDLLDNKIHGLIPQWFVNVTRDSLLSLDLSSNFVTGFEQPVGVLPWPNLEILYLEENMILGSFPIPPNSMVVYMVSSNSLTGGIPRELCQAISLRYLDVSFNSLGGQLPECLSELGGFLYILNLQGNSFHGLIPHSYPESCQLKMINLSDNRLEGSMPRSLANCTMLEILDIGNNRINDTFPSWLGSHRNLQALVLRHNCFYGKIDGPLDNTTYFSSLHIMDLSHNFYTGKLPYGYFRNLDAMKNADESDSNTSGITFTFMLNTPPVYLFPSLEYDYTITITNKRNDILYTEILNVLGVLDFSSNNFTGKIPNFIGDLRGLQAINLSNNNLKGGIPSSLARIRNLESLDLSNNKLSGVIPQQLSQLSFLEVFNVSHNLLVGPIPLGQQFNTFDNSSFDGNSGLCGGSLSKRCGNEDEPPTPSQSNEEGDSLVSWIAGSLGGVVGFVIGCVVGIYITDKNHEWFMETFARKKMLRRTAPKRRS